MNLRSHVVRVLMCTAFVSSFAYADSYQTVRIISPKPDTTVHDNSGNLAVTVAVSPLLYAGAGDRLTVLLDGKAVASGSGQRFELSGIDRGSHTLRVQVKSADGRILAASPPLRFYMWRASRLFRNSVN
jgi:hypothetical protein